MSQTIVEERLPNGVRAVVMPAETFRVVTVRAIWRLEMGRRTTAQALVPMILRRGSRRYPETLQLVAAFESLYGASLHVDAAKVGNAHLVVAELAVPSDRYLPEPVFEDAFDLFGEVIREPALSGGRFREDYVQQEKASLQRTLEGIFNDKAQYAQMKMLEAMFQGDPYSQTRYGRLEDVADVTGETVMEAYRRLMDEAPLSLYAVGAVDADAFIGKATRLFGDLGVRREAPLGRPETRGVPGKVQDVQEVQDVNQGKLVMGYRSGIGIFDEAYTALSVATGIFGGYAHSKLFQNVREKASLAYYAYARLDGFKGVMAVQSGIEPTDKAKAEAIIQQQVDDVQAGRFTAEEMEMTIRAMENQFLAMEDNPSSLVMSHYELDLAGRPFAIEERLKSLRRVRRRDVMEAFRTVSLDTVFFLTNGGSAP